MMRFVLTRRQVLFGLAIIQTLNQLLALQPYDTLNQQTNLTTKMGADGNTDAWARGMDILRSSKLFKVLCTEGTTAKPPLKYELMQATRPDDIGRIVRTVDSPEGREKVLPFVTKYLSGHFEYRTHILAIASQFGLEGIHITNIVRLYSIQTPSSVLLSPPFSPFAPLPYCHICLHVTFTHDSGGSSQCLLCFTNFP